MLSPMSQRLETMARVCSLSGSPASETPSQSDIWFEEREREITFHHVEQTPDIDQASPHTLQAYTVIKCQSQCDLGLR